MLSILSLIGYGLIAFSIGSFLIHTSRFTKVRDSSGVIIYTDKDTGKKYITLPHGYPKDI